MMRYPAMAVAALIAVGCLAEATRAGAQPPPNPAGLLVQPTPDQIAHGRQLFAGSTPLYRGDQLIGGLGVSGDGIEQDDYVTFFGAGEFLPARSKWADRVKIDKTRLPMFKFPRQPEGVTECDGGPCS